MSAAGEAALAPSGAEAVLELPGGGRVLFTTRAAGNLSTGAGAGAERGLEHRAQLCERLGVRWLCAGAQVHGADVHVIERVAGAGGTPLAIDADGHATSLREVGAMVMCADCLPVAIGCTGAVAMLHAGWRGLAAGVLERGVRALRELSGGRRLLAIVGPGAGACCYEVGAEVRSAFAGGFVEGRAEAREGRRERARIDLRAIARERLLAAGVREVRDVDACTICDARFFSHRREGERAGRQAGIAWLS
ncbi:MAG TPA: polyphenol oxidase family protein [Solirubrobacteraceae bacterium]|nr:polyphenol oxidase family protein [Solirubrobacteraceae bacterium]